MQVVYEYGVAGEQTGVGIERGGLFVEVSGAGQTLLPAHGADVAGPELQINLLKGVDVYKRQGGGGGLPRSSELPNGWWLRYSSSRMYDAQRQSIEGGIEPHIIQEQTEEATAKQQDALIERAIALLLKGNK